MYQGDLDRDLRTVGRNGLAEKITGGLSHTTKVPVPSYGLPASRCKLGSVLAKKPGSVCASCYALKGRYRFSAVQKRLEERYQGLFNPLWTPAMIYLIDWHCERYFRWFHSGDVQSENHQQNINTIAAATPHVLHWEPTREIAIIRAVREKIGEYAPNLLVRASGHYVDGPTPDWPTTSSVARKAHREAAEGFLCPSREQSNSCGDCRSCWDPSVGNVVYTLH